MTERPAAGTHDLKGKVSHDSPEQTVTPPLYTRMVAGKGI